MILQKNYLFGRNGGGRSSKKTRLFQKITACSLGQVRAAHQGSDGRSALHACHPRRTGHSSSCTQSSYRHRDRGGCSRTGRQRPSCRSSHVSSCCEKDHTRTDHNGGRRCESPRPSSSCCTIDTSPRRLVWLRGQSRSSTVGATQSSSLRKWVEVRVGGKTGRRFSSCIEACKSPEVVARHIWEFKKWVI